MCVRDVFFLLSLCHNSPPWFFTLKNHSQKEAVPEDFFVSFSFPFTSPEDAFYWIVKVSRKAMFVIMFLPQP